MRNALTIDLEDWYHTKEFDIDRKLWGSYERRIDKGLNLLLDLMDKYNVKATFFCLGVIAAESPKVIMSIKERGHHIGSHGTYHELVYRQTRQEFLDDILYTKNVIQDITGDPVTYFRACAWSIGKENLWALEALEEAGFEVDCSLQPFRTPQAGMPEAPLSPFYPVIGGRRLNLLEFPVSVYSLGKLRFPFAGGFYLRALPLPFIEGALKKVNRDREGIIYIHPWEYDGAQPKTKGSLVNKIIHYYNIGKPNQRKFESLLKKFEFAPLPEIIRSNKYGEKELFPQ